MSLDTIHADGIEEGLQAWARNPGPEPEQSFHVTSFLGAGLMGLPSAALERAGTVSDILSGAATADAASGYSSGGMFSVPNAKEQKDQEAERQRMLTGNAFDNTAGNVLRRKAESFAPDPLTTHTADGVLHSLVRFGAKAVTDITLMGPAGALVTGVDEGNTAAQRLMEQGVEAPTAAKVGAVQGGFAAAGAVLPVGGKTILQTLGLVGVGGPGSYVAQEALSRRILEEAGHNDQASLHNPFDPLGLALSAAIPGVVGGLHVRAQRSALQAAVEHIESGGQRYGADGQLLTSPKGAQGEMQVMPATAKDPGFGVVPARDSSPEELARVGRDYLTAMQGRYPDDAAKALAAYNAGPGAVDKAVAAHGDEWLKNLPRETQEYVHKARALLTRGVAQEAVKDPATVDAARVATLNDAVNKSLPDTHDAMTQVNRASDIVNESGGRVAEQEIAPVHQTDLPQFQEWFGDSKVVDEQGAPLVVYHGTSSDFGGFSPETFGRTMDAGKLGEGFYFTEDTRWASNYAKAKGDEGANVVPAYVAMSKPLEFMRADGDIWSRLRAVSKEWGIEDDPVLPNSGNKPNPDWSVKFTAAAKERGYDGVILHTIPGQREVVAFAPEQIKSAIGNSGKFDRNSASLTDPLRPGERPIRYRESDNALPDPHSVKLEGDEPAKRGAEVGASSAEKGGKPVPAKESAQVAADSGSASEKPSPDVQMAQKLAAESPDLQVVLPGTEERITVAEAMQRIAEEQKQDGQWADLVKVAADCLLSV